jgi:hypothetical protein
MDVRSDLEETYRAAQERAELFREEWEREGRPLLGRGSKGQPVPHPLLRALQQAERHADFLRRSLLPPARMGGPPVAVPGPFGERSAARLRAVGGDPPSRIRRKGT